MKLPLMVDYSSMVHWWVDLSYNTHANCKDHTGAIMSLGQETVLSFLWKQKLNIRNQG